MLTPTLFYITRSHTHTHYTILHHTLSHTTLHPQAFERLPGSYQTLIAKYTAIIDSDRNYGLYRCVCVCVCSERERVCACVCVCMCVCVVRLELITIEWQYVVCSIV
jgi:hypothetical protein